MTEAALAVTGATGRVGGRVARALSGAGLAQRLVVRDPSRAPVLDGAQVVRASYADPAAARAALDGIEVVFMVSGSEEVDRVAKHREFVDAAVAAGVRQLVYLSFYGAASDATFTLARDHFATEQHIRGSGLRWTFVRDNLYLDFFPYMVGEDDAIRGPAGDGRVAAVAIDDIGDAVAAILRGPDAHIDQTYSLTGPQAMTLDEVAARLAAATNRPITFQHETIDEAHASRAHYGAPDWQVEAWVSTYTAIANGELAGVTDDVLRLTCHAPRSLEDTIGQV